MRLSLVEKTEGVIVEDMIIGGEELATEIYNLASIYPDLVAKATVLNPLGYDVFMVSKAVVVNLRSRTEESVEEIKKLGADYAWQLRILQ